MRRYLGTKTEVAALWGITNPEQLERMDKANRDRVLSLAEFADKLGVELHFDIKLPKE
jgi:hypothetical protein